MNPIIAIIMGNLSRKGEPNPKRPLIGDSQPIPYPLHQYLAWTVYDLN